MNAQESAGEASNQVFFVNYPSGEARRIFTYGLSADQRQVGMVRGHTNSDVVLISTARK